jgi:hypothetical protein
MDTRAAPELTVTGKRGSAGGADSTGRDDGGSAGGGAGVFAGGDSAGGSWR